MRSQSTITPCAICGKPVRSYQNRPHTYCSRPCAAKARIGKPNPIPPRKQVQKTCPVCDKVFAYRLSWPRVYCSNVCAGKANVGNTGKPTGTRAVKQCEQCGKTFTATPSQPGRFCSQTCFGRWQSIHNRGDAHPSKGRTFQRPKNLVTLICPICTGAFQVKASHAHKRRFCSKACHGAWMAAHQTGENSATWKGGYQPYYGPNWHKQRRTARERDSYTCQRCGKHEREYGRELDVHHIIPFRLFGIPRYREANQLSNLISLCNVCHLTVEHEQATRPSVR